MSFVIRNFSNDKNLVNGTFYESFVEQGTMSFLNNLNRVPTPLVDVALAANEAGAAILIFDPEDRIIAANDEQRRVMPCCRYEEMDTYSSLFWSALSNGMTGNASAKHDPKTWLHDAIAARRCSPNLDFINSYAWGKMLVSHYRLDDGTSIQARLNMRSIGMDKYFEGNDGAFGISRILTLRNEINYLERSLDSIGVSVALVDKEGRVFHANASFNDLISLNDGLVCWPGGGISALDALDDMVLRQALQNVTSGAVQTAYVPVRRSQGDPLVLSLTPGETRGTAIVAALRFGEDLSEVSRTLQQAFGLSSSEAEVLAGVGVGRSVEFVAEQRNVATKTIYQQIYGAKKSMKKSRFAAPDLPGIARLVAGIAAITRAPTGRKH